MGNATKVAAIAVGDYYRNFGRDRYLLLKDCLYVPSIRRNLISVSSLVKDRYSILFNDFFIIKLNKRFICSGTLMDNLYTINLVSPSLQQNELNNTNVFPYKRKEPSQMNQTYLWHLRLGHINLKQISRLVQNGTLGSLELEARPFCESCLQGKMIRRLSRLKVIEPKNN